MNPAWYLQRLRAMSSAEVVARIGHRRVQRAWRSRAVPVMAQHPAVLAGAPTDRAPVIVGTLPAPLPPLPDEQASSVVKLAEALLSGHWEQFGEERHDFVAPDWFLDPRSGRRAPATGYAFDVPYRDEAAVGNIKQIWEPSRHQHLPVLAMAWRITGDDRFAQRVDAHLSSWWDANPFLTGVHWTSGIELGLRVISWVWTRRLLDGWDGAPALFEDNPVFRAQLHDHQEFLWTLRSTGSSANNHVIAELAGLVVATSACPWWRDSDRRRTVALALFERELRANTFPSGLNRELATEYHALVLELATVVAVERRAAGAVVPEGLTDLLVTMFDTVATVVDCRLQPPRQGDGDDGLVLVLDGPDVNRWESLIATGAALVGPCRWWPAAERDVRTAVLEAFVTTPLASEARRPDERPDLIADAGMALLRTPARTHPEIWCRADAGPHGFLSIAAHAHADALALELRLDGVEVIADPGTYVYHGDPAWRSFMRGTRSHATLELDGRDQSRSGGPFLWTRAAETRLLGFEDTGTAATWSAEHDGYGERRRPVRVRRTVRLDRVHATLGVDDVVVGAGGLRRARLTWPLGPDADVSLDTAAAIAVVSLPGDLCVTIELDPSMTWTARRGDTDPVDGWYSPGFAQVVPAWSLVGEGDVAPGDPALVTTFHLAQPPISADPSPLTIR